MNFILTGAAGFIGFHTTLRLLEQGRSVLGIDSINEYYTATLKNDRLKELGIETSALAYGKTVKSSRYPGFSFVRLGIEDKEELFRAAGVYAAAASPDRIIHLAAQAGVRYSLENPADYISSNISGFLNILELSRELKIPHLVFASSSSVYGLNTQRPFSVHHGADHPLSLYGATKRADELMAHTYAHLFGIPVTGLRFFTVYGPWGRPDMAYYKFSLAIMENRPIDVYRNGEMFRDFTYIDDITGGVILASETIPLPSPGFDPSRPDPASSSAPFRIYNLGNNHPEKLLDFIEALEKALGKTAVKNFLPMQAGDVQSTEADIDDTVRDLGWSPATGIDEGLRFFVSWFKNYYKRTAA
ncbi:MAG: NAD-dependent epimerase/dehydratase family protein [Treponema sp.]|jgi:UDP-glucuronate 4-epimerase|nr:NAD-dependent epimerase/dehydratase family protein [Treponema sp.]